MGDFTSTRTSGGGGTYKGILKHLLPSPESGKIRNYEQRIEYASYDGALRAQYSIYSKHGIKYLSPYEGYKMVELSAMCDPYIFCNQVNKFCLRYSAVDLLPNEILNYKLKRGNPGISLSKVLKSGNNRKHLRQYLETHYSNLIDTMELLKRLSSDNFNQAEFLGLSLLIFEMILREKYGLMINLPAN